MKRSKRRQGGFTLVELMVSLTIFSFVIAGVLAVASSMMQAFREHRQTVTTQDAVRGSMELLTDAIRNASPGVSDPSKVESLLDTSGNCSTGAIVMTDSTSAPDMLDLVYAAGGVMTSIATTSSWATASTASFVVVDATNLAVNDYVMVTDGTTGHVVKISNINGSTLTVSKGGCAATLFPAAGYPGGSYVIRVRKARFYVGTFDGNTNVLLMKPEGAGGAAGDEPLADNIDDFQVSIGIDTNSNYGIEASEWEYSSGVGAIVGGTIRAARITIVARSADPLFGVASFLRPAVEDHPVATATDRYKRRILTSTVEVRNLAGSP